MSVQINNVTISDVEQTNDGKYYIDIDNEKGLQEEKDIKLTKGELETILRGSGVDAGTYDLATLINSIDALPNDAQLADILKRFKSAEKAYAALKEKMKTLKQQLAQAQNNNQAAKAGEIQAKIDQLKPLVDAAKIELQKLFNQLAPQKSSLPTTDQTTFQALADKHQLKDPNANTQTNGTNGGTGSGGLKGASQQGGQNQAANGAPKAAGYTWNYGTGGGYGAGKAGFGFDMNAYLNSIYTDQAVLDGYDSIHENKQKQQKMMMLFFYFAKMAMSGDMSAMYRFMQFILAIISKDKSLQQIHMASKLIELQELNRIATQKLVDFNIDPDDPQSGVDFQKLVEETKAETSSIATSQKLISQMMEEMAQVVETLTGTVKTALDAAGRIGRMLARA